MTLDISKVKVKRKSKTTGKSKTKKTYTSI